MNESTKVLGVPSTLGTTVEPPAPTPTGTSERWIVVLIAAVQFVNVLDFMMVNPLGPDFATGLGIPIPRLPLVAGAYTLSASLAGLGGSFFLERYDRKRALVVALFGLVIGTAAGGFAVDFVTMILARVVAGAFGGPATSLGIAIIADAVPAERRGKAMGVVMGGFSIASVLGVPAGLKLAEWGSWRTTFYGVAALIAVVTFVAARVLPPFRGHIAALPPPGHALESLKAMLAKGRILLSLMMTALANVGAFILILNFPAFIQFNVGFPRADLDKLYLIGGIASFASMRAAGFLVDRFGSTRVGAVGAALLLVVNYLGFVRALPVAWVIPIFVAFFIVNAFRNVAYSTLTSKVPEPSERARFLSIQSAVQHGASAFAAVLATQLLGENPDKSIAHMERVTFTSMALTACVPVAMWLVERTLKKR